MDDVAIMGSSASLLQQAVLSAGEVQAGMHVKATVLAVQVGGKAGAALIPEYTKAPLDYLIIVPHFVMQPGFKRSGYVVWSQAAPPTARYF